MPHQPSHWRRAALLAAVFALATAWLLVRIDDYDVWYHMLVGREVLRTGSIPTAEFYKYPLLGQPGGFHEWGFGVLAELAQRMGWWALALLNAAIGAGTFLLIALAAVRRGASWWAALLLLGPLALETSFRFCYRPETMLYLAIGATLYALEAKRWAVLPALTVSLALFHPSPLILLLVAGTYAVDIAIEERRPTKRLGIVSLLIVASALAVGLAPYGLHQLTMPLGFSRLTSYLATIEEFAPALSSPRRWHFVGLALASLMAVAFVPRRRTSDVLLVLGFGYLAFEHARSGAMLALVLFGPAVMVVDRVWALFPSAVRIGATITSLVAVSVCFLASPDWGWGLDEHWFPVRTADFILAHRPPGRLMNDLRNGGYLAWRLYPDYLVSVDGRMYQGRDLPMQISDGVLQTEPGWREIVDRYDITMVATWPVNFVSGELTRSIAELDRDPAWVPVITEPAGVLFVKRSTVPGVAGVSREALWEHVRDAADAVAVPERPGAYLARGTANFKLHDFRRAATDFARYSELVPSDAETASVARQLAAAVAGDPAALRLTEAAYARSVNPP